MAILFTLSVPEGLEIQENTISANLQRVISLSTVDDSNNENETVNQYECTWYLIDKPTTSNASIVLPGNGNRSITLDAIDVWGTYRIFCVVNEIANNLNKSETNPLKSREEHFVNISVTSTNNQIEKPANHQRNWKEKYDRLVDVVDNTTKKIGIIQVPGASPALSLTLPTSVSANTYLKTNASGQLTFSSLSASDIEISNLGLNNLSDVDTTSTPPENGQALVYNNNVWAPGDVAGGGSISLSDISATSNAASGGGSFSYDNSTGVFSYTPPDLTSFLTSFDLIDDTTPQLGGNLDGQAFNITTTGKILFSNVYATEGDLPSAATYHGMFAHVHATGKAYFAHGGNWIKLASETDVPTTTTNIAEGDNLYYTNERADQRATLRINAAVLHNLSNVNSTVPEDGQVLKWDDSNGYWNPADDIANVPNVAQIQYDINASNPEHSVEGKLFYDSGTNTLTFQQPHLDDVIREDDIEIVLNNAVENQASSLVYNASGPNGKPTFTFQPEFLTNKIELTDISVSTNAANSGGALSYDNSTGVLSFTPADVSGGGGGGGLSNWTETNGHLLPNADATYDIGSAAKKVRHLYLSDSSLNIGDANITFDSTRKLLSMSNEGISFTKSFSDEMNFDSVSTIQNGNYYTVYTVGDTSLSTWEALGITNATSIYSSTTELSNASDDAKTFLAIRNGTGADGSGQIVPVDIVERALTIEEFKKDSYSGSNIFSLSYRTPNPNGFGNINHIIPSISSDPSVLSENAVLELNYNSWEWQWKDTSSIGGSFTGTHPSVIDNQENIFLGLIVDSTGILWANETDNNISTSIPKVTLSKEENSKKCFGVIANTESVFATFSKKYGVAESEKQITINSLGEGKVWVTNIKGAVENGDYITTSEILGHGQLQNDDLLHNYTVAKCTEHVDWSAITDLIDHNGVQYKKYLISCTYHCG